MFEWNFYFIWFYIFFELIFEPDFFSGSKKSLTMIKYRVAGA